MLFRKKMDKACAYCAYSGKIDDSSCICAKKGIVSPEDCCRRFRYDPLKRVPLRRKAQDFSRYDDFDFSL